MTISSQPSAPLVAVIGATGIQGGSVVRNLIESDKPYRLRGLTRDATKPAAQALAALGVEVVAANIIVGNEAAVREAFAGADVVFGVTKFMEHKDAEREFAEGKLMADAAKAAGVKLFVFSGLPYVSKLSGGKYPHVVHFDSKARVVEYARTQLPTVDVQAGFYITNLAGFYLGLKKLEDSTYLWEQPTPVDPPYPYIDTERDYGLFVRFAIESPKFNQGGGTIFTYGEFVRPSEAAAALQRLRGIQIKITTLDHDAARALLEGAGLSPQLVLVYLDVVAYAAEFGLYFKGELEPEQQAVWDGLPRKPRTFEEYLKAHPEFFASG